MPIPSRPIGALAIRCAKHCEHDVAQLFAARLEAGNIDPAALRGEWESARRREFVAQIYDFTKSTLDMDLYLTDERGIVVFDSNAGKTEGQDFHDKRDVALTLAG